MKDSLEELSARGRRGELSSAEQRKLEMLLKASFEARLWHRAGTEFDAEASVLPGDDEVAERVMRRVLAEFPAKPRHSQPRRMALIGFAMLFGASLAAAAVIEVREHLAHRSALPAATSARIEARNVRSEPSPTPQPLETAVPSFTVPPRVLPVPQSSVTARGPSNHPKAETHKPSEAAELFTAAARARREGDTRKAITLYDSLQSAYPSSVEARASDMALGMLHLKRSAHAAALEHFRRYLRHSARGQLAPEALWGEAQALTGLGQHAEARRSLSKLLERYPDSTYANAARTKLGAEASTP